VGTGGSRRVVLCDGGWLGREGRTVDPDCVGGGFGLDVLGVCAVGGGRGELGDCGPVGAFCRIVVTDTLGAFCLVLLTELPGGFTEMSRRVVLPG